MTQEAQNSDPITPKFRYALKAEIIKAGYRTLTDFSTEIGVDLARISKIVSGWELPGPHLQRTMAECLGITLTELKELLR